MTGLSPYYAFMQSEETIFQYSGVERFIRIIETSPRQQETERCLVLDETLSVIEKDKGRVIDYQVEGGQPGQLEGAEGEGPIFNLVQIQSDSKKYYFERKYQQYPLLKDFLIGRANWGRDPLTLKIESDSVSRDHTKLAYHCEHSNEQQSLSTLTQAIQASTRMSSKWRRLSPELLSKISSYSIDKPYYSLQDCNSRNGTFLMNFSVPNKPLQMGQTYQFQSYNYILTVHHISLSTGKQITKLLDEFYTWHESYLFSYRDEIVLDLPEDVTREGLDAEERAFNLLHLELFVNHQYKLHYWIATARVAENYSIGEGMAIDVQDSGEFAVTSRHGVVMFKDGQWLLAPGNKQENIWVKLTPNEEVVLSQPRYKVMIAHFTVLELSFHNFT